jgi:N-carbamoyl-D-amino-acid hydrolase
LILYHLRISSAIPLFGKNTIFDFDSHRRIEHYGRIISQTGVILPPEA